MVELQRLLRGRVVTDPELIAHVSGFPVEELAPLVGGAGGLVAVRAWLSLRVRARMRR